MSFSLNLDVDLLLVKSVM